jgi:hypothetical protein
MPGPLRGAPKTLRSLPEGRLEQLALSLEQAYQNVEHELEETAKVYRSLEPSAAHTGTIHPHEVLCVKPATRVQQIRTTAELWRGLRDCGIELPPIGRLRKEPSPASKEVRPEQYLEALRQWVVENRCGPKWWFRAWRADSGVPFPLEVFARSHHTCRCKTCIDEGIHGRTCHLTGVCRTTSMLVDCVDIPLKRAVMDLARRSFKAAAALEAMSRQLEGSGSSAEHLADLAACLRGSGESIWDECLHDPRRPAPPGRGRPRTLRAQIQHLEWAGLEFVAEDGGIRVTRARSSRVHKDQRTMKFCRNIARRGRRGGAARMSLGGAERAPLS